MKNIIPAIASTNALISAACVNEAVKIVTQGSYLLNNFMQYNGVNLKGCMLHEYAKKPNCVCSTPLFMHVDKNMSLGELRKKLEVDFSFVEPSLFTVSDAKTLYLKSQHESWKDELPKPIHQLFASKECLKVADVQKREAQVVVIF